MLALGIDFLFILVLVAIVSRLDGEGP